MRNAYLLMATYQLLQSGKHYMVCGWILVLFKLFSVENYEQGNLANFRF
jgi:hypothetical protein